MSTANAADGGKRGFDGPNGLTLDVPRLGFIAKHVLHAVYYVLS